jgi:PPOX class probable FMN-dependent enzyme
LNYYPYGVLNDKRREAKKNMQIQTVAQLRSVYAQAKPRALKKQMSSLDVHALTYISLSPFFVLSTGDRLNQLDASPRGGHPGFVKALDAHTLLIPDASGNNRLDSLQNILDTAQVGLLFMIPGFDETLRINGTASIHSDPELLAKFSGLDRSPKAVIKVSVREVYLHCAKAFMRAHLWSPAAQVSRSELPTMNEMIHEQTQSTEPLETQEQMLQRYQADL